MTKPLQVLCPYCGKGAKLVDSAELYAGRSYGWVWLCKCVPGWAYVGCHRGSTNPLGRLANQELRLWKMKAHAAFDVLWKNGPVKRAAAYTWLRRVMGLSAEECHIGLFSVEQCKQVVALCEPIKNEIERGCR